MWHLEIENIAGIRSGTATIEPGINAIQASNWQGKTSLITSIETVIGAEKSLTESEEQGSVQLEIDNETYIAELSRQNGNVVRHGEGYPSDERDVVAAELFAFLDEANPIRRAVRNGENLEDLLTRPLDLENIDEKIADLREERQQIETELEAAEEAATKLPRAQEQVTLLESELENLREEREEIATDTAGDAEQRDTLSSKRATRDRIQGRIDDLESQIGNLEGKLEDRRAELEKFEIPDESGLESGIAEKRDKLSEIEAQIDLLQTVFNANKRVLDEGQINLLADIERGIMEDELTCWVCGEQAPRNAFDSRLDALNERISELRQDANALYDEVSELEDQQEQLKRQRRRKADLEREIKDLESRITDRQMALEDAKGRFTDLKNEIEELEAEVETTDDRMTGIESEMKYKEAELNDAREELDRLQNQADRREQLQAQIDNVSSEIEDLRTRKEQIKQTVHTAFEEAMEDILAEFAPGFERAWLDNFELRIVREGRSTSVDALSEGEVELLGIIAALAGYDAFDIAERIPIILLDGLGGLASEHLHRLVTFLEGRAEYVVTTAYPEAGDFDGHVITPDDWTVVSEQIESVH